MREGERGREKERERDSEKRERDSLASSFFLFLFFFSNRWSASQQLRMFPADVRFRFWALNGDPIAF